MNMQPIYLFKTMFKALGKGIIILLKPRPKYRIKKTKNKKFLPQIFIGFWKFGIYCELGYSKAVIHDFEKDTIDEAENVIIKTRRNSNIKSFIIKEYHHD